METGGAAQGAGGGRETGLLVYPVHSRRAGGLSVGINLFPDKKHCAFDCPYCEVFDFQTGAVFSLKQMERDLRMTLADAKERGVPVKDVCFSGSGEPTLSPHFAAALDCAGSVRGEIAPEAALVLITCGSGLLQEDVFSRLREAAAAPLNLDIWLKLDAATQDWYEKMNRSSLPLEGLKAKIRELAACAPVTIQTMLCRIDGLPPPPQEEAAWEDFILALPLAAGGAGLRRGLRKVQIYGKARAAPEDPKASSLPVEHLEKRAASLRQRFSRAAVPSPAVEVYP